MTNKRIDLHTHSLCSDGAQTPTDVVRTAKEAGLAAIALSDHDSIEGVQEAMDAGKALGVEVIPAVELSAQSDTELHILGYFVDIHNKKLQDTMAYALKVRDQRQEETCRKLNEQGFHITMEEAREEAHGNPVLCRAHFAQIMVRKGYAPSVQEAFKQFFCLIFNGYFSSFGGIYNFEFHYFHSLVFFYIVPYRVFKVKIKSVITE